MRLSLPEHGNVSEAGVLRVPYAVVKAASDSGEGMCVRADGDALAAHAPVFIQHVLRRPDALLPAAQTSRIQLERVPAVDARA